MATAGRANLPFGSAAMIVVGAFLLASPAAAEVPPAVKFVIGGLNAQLPLELGLKTTLVRLATDGDVVDAILEVEPGSPLNLGIDVRSEAARLCGIAFVRKLTALMASTKIRVSYVNTDQAPVGSFEIDRTICGQ